MDRLNKIRERIHEFAKMKNLYRIEEGSLIGGICMMLAEKFSIQVIFIRLLFIILASSSLGVGLILYLMLVYLLPKKHRIENDYIDVEFREKKTSRE
ncbi:PspC domain-containing protein, partial [Streptococcus danieliae]|nr:PspC domain-containing protein [Streptococcus danieliae]